MPRSEAGASGGAVYWLICDGTGPPGALVLDLAGLGRTLPVFSFPEEAEMFMRLDDLDGDWEVREGVADDFFPHFFGPCERVESVVLDPLPGTMGRRERAGRHRPRAFRGPLPWRLRPRRGAGLTRVIL